MGKQFFVAQNISLLVATTIPQVVMMTKDAVTHFSTMFPPPPSAVLPLTENHFEAKDGLYVENGILTQEDSFT